MNATTRGSPAANPDQAAPTRRTFYLEVIYGLWALISATLAGLAGAYLFVLPKAKKEGQWVDAADLTKLPLKTPQEVVFTHNRADGWKITSEKATAWVVRLSDNQAVAFAPHRSDSRSRTLDRRRLSAAARAVPIIPPPTITASASSSTFADAISRSFTSSRTTAATA